MPWSPLKRGSDNMQVLGHLPLGPRLPVADMELEQEMHRPHAYVAHTQHGPVGPKGLDIIRIADLEQPELLSEWRIENQGLHLPTGAMDTKHFKWNDGYYAVQSLEGERTNIIMDPHNPVTVGFYHTYVGSANADRYPVFNGTFGVDVRIEDGLIVMSDMPTGLWTFRMDGFQGWHGEHWGMPNISSAQNWDEPVVRRPVMSQEQRERCEERLARGRPHGAAE